MKPAVPSTLSRLPGRAVESAGGAVETGAGTGARALRLARLRAALPGASVRPGGIVAHGLGDPALDQALPWGGLATGAVHEVAGISAADRTAAGGFTAALAARLVAGASAGSGAGSGGLPGRVMWCVVGGSGQPGLPYGPGLAAFGLLPRSLFMVDARSRADALWAMEQGLRARQLTAVVGEIDRLDLVEGRRLALAAEAGGATALILRAASPVGEPSAAWTRWQIGAAPAGPGPYGQGLGSQRWAVSLARCRGGPPRDWLVEWQDEAHCLAVVAPVADRLLAPLTDDGAAASPAALSFIQHHPQHHPQHARYA